MNEDTKKQAVTFLQEHSIGVLATVSPEGTPRARTVYYAANEAFDLYFLTIAGTRKVEDINLNNHAAFVVSDETTPATLQIEGVLSEQPDASVSDPMVQKLMDTLFAKGDTFAPLTHLDPSKILCYKLTPTWMRWGNFSGGMGTDEVLTDLTT
jgi:general stress protein 26